MVVRLLKTTIFFARPRKHPSIFVYYTEDKPVKRILILPKKNDLLLFGIIINNKIHKFSSCYSGRCDVGDLLYGHTSKNYSIRNAKTSITQELEFYCKNGIKSFNGMHRTYLINRLKA